MENISMMHIDSLIDKKYVFNEKDISFDIVDTISRVVEIIAKKGSSSFDDSYAAFMESHVYKALTNTKTLLWAENPEFIADEYYREIGKQSTAV
ncbi:MAG: hypothetical protein LBM77_06285 [Spirochaetaceae bacterium]|jgi:hypothetical protein|nr:hypothetical protein [Spirochaetaceae bacterium]